MNEEIRCITSKGKLALNECENDGSDFLRVLFGLYKKLGQLFFHTYSLTCLNKDAAGLLKVMRIWASWDVSLNVWTFLKALCICTQSL